ncbi:MAG: hypothetical protein PHF11_07280, partial [Candidatus Omnitrophica bacterium]|nr:hypothetical protein [Candidatus Omnitrophota bacterium]
MNLNVVVVEPGNPKSICTGSNNAVFKSEDSGQSWRNVLSVKGQNRAVNFLAFDEQDKNALYAATGNGLFYSDSQGKYWRRIFTGKNYLENDCTSIVAFRSVIYLGTRSGLFISRDKGRSWHKSGGKIGKNQILAIVCNKKISDIVYIASNEGVFKSRDKGESWAIIFTDHAVESSNSMEEVPEERNETGSFCIRCISTDPDYPDRIYLATSRGIYKSEDA